MYNIYIYIYIYTIFFFFHGFQFPTTNPIRLRFDGSNSFTGPVQSQYLISFSINDFQFLFTLLSVPSFFFFYSDSYVKKTIINRVINWLKIYLVNNFIIIKLYMTQVLYFIF